MVKSFCTPWLLCTPRMRTASVVSPRCPEFCGEIFLHTWVGLRSIRRPFCLEFLENFEVLVEEHCLCSCFAQVRRPTGDQEAWFHGVKPSTGEVVDTAHRSPYLELIRRRRRVVQPSMLLEIVGPRSGAEASRVFWKLSVEPLAYKVARMAACWAGGGGCGRGSPFKGRRSCCLFLMRRIVLSSHPNRAAASRLLYLSFWMTSAIAASATLVNPLFFWGPRKYPRRESEILWCGSAKA
jgi:hypothetical protein